MVRLPFNELVADGVGWEPAVDIAIWTTTGALLVHLAIDYGAAATARRIENATMAERRSSMTMRAEKWREGGDSW